ncbi:hypothetical protein AUP68_05455 [Ilyonectria robusta]
MTARIRPTGMTAQEPVVEPKPGFGAPNRISTVAGRIRDARYDDMLSDLRDQQSIIAEDTTIYVKIEPSCSPPLQTDRKRRCDREPTMEIRPKPTGLHLKKQDCTNALVGEFSATAARRIKNANYAGHAIQPKAGDLYLVYRRQSQRWLAALLPSLEDLDDLGISGTIDSLGLPENVSSYHTYNANTRGLAWRDEYEGSGPSSHKRKFPILYFAGPRFPDSGAADWVAAEDLRFLDESYLQPSIVPYYSAVRAFLARRTVSRALKARMGDSVSPCDEQVEDFDNTSCSSDQSPPPRLDVSKTDFSMGMGFDRLQCVSTGNSWSTFRVRSPDSSSGITRDLSNNSSAIPLCTQETLDTCRLPRIKKKKQQLSSIVLPRLSMHLSDMSEHGVRFGFFEWPEDLPQRIVDLIAEKSKVKRVEPLPRDFRTSRHLFRCPLCDDGRKEFVRLKWFTNHLLEKH